jgi:predicted nucleotidyltransferase
MSTIASSGDLLDLIDAVVYGDVFDCAVTRDEVSRYSRCHLSRADIDARLEAPAVQELIVERNGLLCLRDRPDLIHRRATRLDRARVLEQRGRRVARFLRHAPFVRALALTGSAAAADAGTDADADLLVVTAQGRLTTAFLLLGTLSRVVRRRFCPNYYVSEDSLAIEPRTSYIARELAQARTLAGDGTALLAANPWVRKLFPNLAEAATSAPSGSSPLQRALEAPLRGGLGDRLERLARHVAARRLAVHYAGLGWNVPTDVAQALARGTALRFHGLHEVGVLDRYEERRRQVAGWVGAPSDALAGR